MCTEGDRVKRNNCSFRKFLVGLVACGVVSMCGVVTQPGVAKADWSNEGAAKGILSPFIFVLVVVPAVANEVFLVTSSIVNGVAAGKGKRPSTGWLWLGYTSSIINIIGGAAFVVVGLGGRDYAVAGLGTAALALGGAGLGLTIWGHGKPTNPGPKLTLRPMVGPDARGGIIAGAALELAGF